MWADKDQRAMASSGCIDRAGKDWSFLKNQPWVCEKRPGQEPGGRQPPPGSHKVGLEIS